MGDHHTLARARASRMSRKDRTDVQIPGQHNGGLVSDVLYQIPMNIWNVHHTDDRCRTRVGSNRQAHKSTRRKLWIGEMKMSRSVEECRGQRKTSLEKHWKNPDGSLTHVAPVPNLLDGVAGGCIRNGDNGQQRPDGRPARDGRSRGRRYQ